MNPLSSSIHIAIAHMKFTFRRNMMIFILIVQPLFFTTLAYLVYHQSEVENMGARILFASGLTTLWSGIVFSTMSDIERERFMGTLELLFASVHGLRGSLCPKAAGNLLLCIIPMGILWIAIYGVLRVPIHMVHPLKTILSMGVFLTHLYLFSLFMASFFALSRNSRVLMNAFEFPFFLLSGFVFPHAFLPPWLKSISLFSPMTYPIHMLRSAMLGETVFLSWSTLLWISIGLSVLFFILIHITFRIMERSVKVSGAFSLT